MLITWFVCVAATGMACGATLPPPCHRALTLNLILLVFNPSSPLACCAPCAGCRLEEALLQNSLADILTADLDTLCDEEGDGLAATAGASSSGAAGGARGNVAGAAGAAGGGGGHRQERGGLTEAQSFTDLAYSKNKVCLLPVEEGRLKCFAQQQLSFPVEGLTWC